ncbi:MAG: efflux RND transporter periplasmic adaptor subunit [Chloroflexi bacterium]|nr:efflux RND transporter periplasmic adaptor subunit [Chloroflexota bacterium]
MNIRLSWVNRTVMLLLVVLPFLLLACQRGGQPEPAAAAAAAAGVVAAPAAKGNPGPSRPQASPPTTAEVPKPAAAPISLRSYAGEVRARDTVAITPRTSGRIEEVRVRVGDRVKAGDVVAVLDHTLLDAQVRQAEAVLASRESDLRKLEAGARPEQIAAAQADLDAARAKLDALLSGPTREQIAAAEANLAKTRAKLDQRLAGPTREQIKAAENDLEAAKRDRAYQESLSDISLNPIGAAGAGKLPNYTPEMRSGVLSIYDQKIQIAADKLEALKAPPMLEELAQLRADVDAAVAQLQALTAKPKASDVAERQSAINSAQAKLDLAKAPYTEYDLAKSRADVAQARASLELSRATRAEAFLIAPVDGFVSTRDFAPGALALTNSAIATIVSQDVEVVLSVEEKALGMINKGMPVSIAIWGSQAGEVRGEVASLAPAVKITTRTFDVYVTVSPGSPLVPGMFVTVTLPEK